MVIKCNLMAAERDDEIIATLSRVVQVQDAAGGGARGPVCHPLVLKSVIVSSPLPVVYTKVSFAVAAGQGIVAAAAYQRVVAAGCRSMISLPPRPSMTLAPSVAGQIIVTHILRHYQWRSAVLLELTLEPMIFSKLFSMSPWA